MKKKLTEFERGRIEGALSFWYYMAGSTRDFVPSVDSILGLPPGTTTEYLRKNPVRK